MLELQELSQAIINSLLMTRSLSCHDWCDVTGYTVPLKEVPFEHFGHGAKDSG